jgi:hypothetical protein
VSFFCFVAARDGGFARAGGPSKTPQKQRHNAESRDFLPQRPLNHLVVHVAAATSALMVSSRCAT